MEDILEDIPTEPIPNFKCRFCSFTAMDKNVLAKHETRHYRLMPPYRCPQCPKVFKERYHLQSHLYTHDTARHFKCPICARTFRHSSSLARHKRSHRLAAALHHS